MITNIDGDAESLHIPLSQSDGIPFGQWIYLFCEVGTASNYSYLRVLSNGKEVARHDLYSSINLGSRRWLPTLGADEHGQNPAAFYFLEIAVWSTTLSDITIAKLTENSLQRHQISP